MWRKRDNSQSLDEVFLNKNGISFEEFEKQTKPYDIPGIEIVQQYILESISIGKHITIVGDYDVDGVCASGIMGLTLKYLGADFSIRLPKRISEGYGLSDSIIDEISEGLIITVDNGIAAINAIKKGKDKGLEVIVTDHHLPVKDKDTGNIVLPEADFILDPHISESEFEDYCGAGIAYKICYPMVPENIGIKLLSFAAIATIADMVPLVKENRLIVREGLKNLTNQCATTIGLKMLLSEMNLNNYIEEGDIGFRVAPALNAPGRLIDDGAKISLSLLMEDEEPEKAKSLAIQAKSLNEERKEMTEDIMQDIERNIIENAMSSDCPLIIYQPHIPEGLSGLLSGKIAEKYRVPTIVFTDSENPDILKGSGRSNGDINIFNMLNAHNDMYVKFGGHADACGMSVTRENLEKLRNILTTEYISYTIPGDDIFYDLEVREEEIPRLLKEIEKYRPFGMNNENFIFKVLDYELFPDGNKYHEVKGDNKKTIVLYSKNSKAANFKMADRYLLDGCPRKLNLVGTICHNYYFNTYKSQMVFAAQVLFDDYEIVKSVEKMSLLQRKLIEKTAELNRKENSNAN